MNVGEIIKNRRKEIGMSVDELAEKLNKNRSTIYRYENGEIENMPIDVIYPIAEALRTTPAHLLGWDSEEIDAVANMQADVAAYEDSKEEQLKQALLQISDMATNNESLASFFLNICKLELSDDELEDVMKYATFISSRRK